MNERKYVAVSIKHSAYKWRYGNPLCLWGHRTKDDEKRCFAGYTMYPNNAEVYSLKDWHESGYGSIIKMDEPVHLEIGFCKKWKNYDTVLVEFEEYITYCKLNYLALDRPKD